MTNTSYNRGYHDGKNSKSMNNPIHNNWNGEHPNKAYEADYWKGYKS